jgi:deoxyuridine 5'-triphosphate nucleotidohydrolase
MKGVFFNRLRFNFIDQTLHCYIYTSNIEEADEIANYSGQTCEISELESHTELIEGTGYKYCITWDGCEAIDLLHKLNGSEIYSSMLIGLNTSQTLKTKFVKTRPDAVTPTRAHFSDTGFDLTILEAVKSYGQVTLYTTGIKVQPPHGYYFDLVPRSSISKTGYTLANNIGIIDQNYRGEIMIALNKCDPNAKDIVIPCKIAQLIPRIWYNMIMEESSVDSTSRNEGGFGSSG